MYYKMKKLLIAYYTAVTYNPCVHADGEGEAEDGVQSPTTSASGVAATAAGLASLQTADAPASSTPAAGKGFAPISHHRI
jgi:hypothetical protein